MSTATPSDTVRRFGAAIRAATIIAVLGLAVAAPAVGAASGGPVKGATYKGLVGPGYPISFRVSSDGRSVESLAAGSEPECLPGPTTAPIYHFPTMAIKQGSFSGKTSKTAPKQSDVLEITGHFTGKTVSGKLTEKLKIKSIPGCTNTQTFTATAK